MNKTRKLLRLLAGLGEEVTMRDVVEVHMDDGYTHIDITVDHKSVLIKNLLSKWLKALKSKRKVIPRVH